MRGLPTFPLSGRTSIVGLLPSCPHVLLSLSLQAGGWSPQEVKAANQTGTSTSVTTARAGVRPSCRVSHRLLHTWTCQAFVLGSVVGGSWGQLLCL